MPALARTACMACTLCTVAVTRAGPSLLAGNGSLRRCAAQSGSLSIRACAPQSSASQSHAECKHAFVFDPHLLRTAHAIGQRGESPARRGRKKLQSKRVEAIGRRSQANVRARGRSPSSACTPCRRRRRAPLSSAMGGGCDACAGAAGGARARLASSMLVSLIYTDIRREQTPGAPHSRPELRSRTQRRGRAAHPLGA
jgi:hypothetical protein